MKNYILAKKKLLLKNLDRVVLIQVNYQFEDKIVVFKIWYKLLINLNYSLNWNIFIEDKNVFIEMIAKSKLKYDLINCFEIWEQFSDCSISK